MASPLASSASNHQKPRIEAVRTVDMSASNAWAEFAAIFSRTRDAHAQHEHAKTELKNLMPEEAKIAIGHGIRAKRSKSGAIDTSVAGHGRSGRREWPRAVQLNQCRYSACLLESVNRLLFTISRRVRSNPTHYN
jgi:hypothetical protein